MSQKEDLTSKNHRLLHGHFLIHLKEDFLISWEHFLDAFSAFHVSFLLFIIDSETFHRSSTMTAEDKHLGIKNLLLILCQAVWFFKERGCFSFFCALYLSVSFIYSNRWVWMRKLTLIPPERYRNFVSKERRTRALEI